MIDQRPKLIIRPMTPADLTETIDVWVASWQTAYPAIDFEARRDWIIDRIHELERDGSQTLTIAKENRIAGFMVVNPATGYLDQIVIAAEDQGSGAAEMLLLEARRISPAGLDLHVNQDNSRAIRFYEKHGFRKIGEDVNPRSGAPIYNMRWRP